MEKEQSDISILDKLEKSNIDINKNIDDISNDTLNWLFDFNILNSRNIKNFKKGKYTVFGSYMYPDAGTLELRLANDFVVWLFIFDDYIDENFSESVENIIQTINNLKNLINNNQLQPILSYNDIIKLFKDWYERYKKSAELLYVDDFKNCFINYLNACLNELQLKQQQNILKFEEYMLIRRDLGAIRPCFNMIKYMIKLNSLNFTYEENIIIQQLSDYATDHVIFVNDIISYKKENNNNDVSNLIIIYVKKYNLTLKDAFNKTCFEANQTLNSLKYVKNNTNNKNIIKYAEWLEKWIMGHIEWCKISNRFNLFTRI